MKLRTFKKDNILTAEIRMTNNSYTVSLKDYLSTDYGIIDKNPCLGNIIHFECDNNKLTARFGFGITSNKFPAPVYVGDILADVNYKNGIFSMNNFRFES